jgi:hypothetical protein
MAVDLLQAITNPRTTSVNFFNGRLLSGEDLTTEQKANRAAHHWLGQAIGDGVVYGLEVQESIASSSVQTPVLLVNPGLAVNRTGAALALADVAEVSLVRPATPSSTGASTFSACSPVQTGAYIAGAGVYLLTIAPAQASQGVAPVNGISTLQASCNTKYNVDGVQFRLIPTSFTQAELSDLTHLRNTAAYKCFGLDFWDALRTDAFGTTPTSFGLVDQLRRNQQLTNCEVPLALLAWTATGGIVFIDMWAVRRASTRRDASARWALAVNQRPLMEAEAAFLQFQDHLDALRNSTPAPQQLKATDFFRYLPPAGLLPIFSSSAAPGFDYLQFFSGQTLRNPAFIDGARLETILRKSLEYRPIDLQSGEMIWLYLVRQNQQAITQLGTSPQPYLMFVTGQAPNYGDAHFDVSRWGFSNFL